jgi:transposase
MTLQFTAEVVCEQLTLSLNIDTPNGNQALRTTRRRFRRYKINEAVMLLQVPKSILPKDHKAFFVMELVSRRLDLSEILSVYNRGDGRGCPPYDPAMMTGLLIYSYLSECETSRKIEEATYDVLPCRMITGDQHPDHDTINEFRSKHLPALAKLFEQSVTLAEESNLISLKHVAADGSKFKANASKHKAMSYDRMCQTIEKYEKEIPEIKAKIELASNGNIPVYQGQLLELHKDLSIREKRLPVIEAAKVALEKRIKREAARRKKKTKKEGNRATQQKKKQAVKGRVSKKSKKARTPEEKAQRNFTDPDSRIMPWKKTFEQCYNAQIAVDSQTQIIVGNYVNQATNDKKELLPMVCQISRRFGRLPDNMSADTGYFSEENLTNKVWNKLGITSLHIPPAKEEKGKKPAAKVGRMPKDISEAEKMVRKLRTRAGRDIYRKRKSIVEPVFGQIKRALDFDEFRLRGLKRVNQEFSFVCAIQNFKKIYTYAPDNFFDASQFVASTG